MFRQEVNSWNDERIGTSEIHGGDIVVVHSRFDELLNLELKKHGNFHNRYGIFNHDDLLGKNAGRRWITASGKVATGAGFVIVLRPTPELWTLSLSHRTQIVYTHDIAVITAEMDLRPGSIVVEAGTGSGSMTASLARAVAPTGRVVSFEIHEDRAKKATEDFEKLGISDYITVTHRNVGTEGFKGIPESSVDAVFLDLPAVWDVAAEAERILRVDGVLATFSPCVEQVQQTYEELSKLNFSEIETSTVGFRTWDTKKRSKDYSQSETEQERKRKRVSEGRGNQAGERSGIPDKDDIVKKCDVELVSRPYREIMTHTSYLTFARRLENKPKPSDAKVQSEGGDKPGGKD
ncbi:hypothetical protein NDN08_003696 [Rhodosorus marinus]|uniref:tRNA (adenine(58)-N(1))-methyltransferase n=1 Tax=Rhodosorus marinus TaxID=101924 RepID=A0AAV8UX89_9RHOD|nr:hypothetical protein NDN08_003696 [Rhodosorus marinus]